ncbi:MAG: PaaI family thioesterase [Xanthomonadales bacterium]|nr:PaaI family thioesterase [Xanthomonadales bacterium]
MNTKAVKNVFHSAPFIAALGMKLESVGEGECVTTLELAERHLQQNGVVHAGVLFTVADHTAGGAASTLVPTDAYVLSAEVKISLLRAAKGEKLICRARVLKPGKRLSFVEAEVFCVADGKESLVAKASGTMAVIAAG